MYGWVWGGKGGVYDFMIDDGMDYLSVWDIKGRLRRR